jgi:hypothetical protein
MERRRGVSCSHGNFLEILGGSSELVLASPIRGGEFHFLMSQKRLAAGNKTGKHHAGRGIAVPFLAKASYRDAAL